MVPTWSHADVPDDGALRLFIPECLIAFMKTGRTLQSFQGTRGVLKLMAKGIYLVRRHAKPRTTLIKKCAKASAERIVATQPKADGR